MTVVLNLDTSVVSLTPIVLHAARSRRLDERAFLDGSVFMANSASLLLPGSNLTNLLVLSGDHLNGAGLGLRMLPAWLAAVGVTALVLMVWQWRALRSEGGGSWRPLLSDPGWAWPARSPRR